MEGLGDDAGAARWYGEFIRFGSQIPRRRAWVACHDGIAAPRDMTWYRDWWAGSAYADSVTRLQPLEEAIAEHERLLTQRPNDITLRMKLAYLYQENQDRHQAAAMWAQAERSSRGTVE